MSVITTTTSKPISIFYNEVTDLGKIERIVQALSGYSIKVELQQSDNYQEDLLQQEAEAPKIAILACKSGDAELIQNLLANKADSLDLIVLALEPFSKKEFTAEGYFYLDASELPEDLICQWLSRKIFFFKSFADASSTIYSRAMHWSENNYETELLLEQNELFEAIAWLEQSVESQKELRNLTLKIDYIAASRQKHYKYADAYLHCGNFFQHIGNPILHTLRDRGLEVIAGNFISPKVYEHKFNEQEIKRSHTFIFVYSPNSSQHNDCKRALSYARSLNKRIITLMAPGMKDCQLPPEIDKNDVVYIPEDWMYHDDFVKVIEEKIKKDYDYVNAHTQYIIESFDWIKHKKSYKLLIKEQEGVNKAAEWLRVGEQLSKSPLVSPLQKLYIERSLATFNLQKNIKLGTTIFFVLLLVLGTLFLLFLNSSEQEGENTQNVEFKLSKHNNDELVNTARKWMALTSQNANETDYLKFFYNKERQVSTKYKTKRQVQSVDVHFKKKEFLITYGTNQFELINTESGASTTFKVPKGQVFKAVFVPEKEKVISAGTELCMWDSKGKLEKKINPGNSSICQDFVFFSNSQKFLFLLNGNSFLLTDQELNELASFSITENNTNSSIRSTVKNSVESSVESSVNGSDNGSSKDMHLKSNYQLFRSDDEDQILLVNQQSVRLLSLSEKVVLEEEKLPAVPLKIQKIAGTDYLLGKDQVLYVKEGTRWKNTGISLELSDFVEAKQVGLFLLDEKKGIFYWDGKSRPVKVFSKKNAVSYQSLKKSDDFLLCLAKDKFGESLLLNMPSSIPNYFIKTYAFPAKTRKVLSAKTGFFLINEKGLAFFDKSTEKVLWKKNVNTKITAATFNPFKQSIVLGGQDGTLRALSDSGTLLWEKSVSKKSISAVICDQENIICGDTNGDLICLDASKKIKFEEKKHQGAIHFLTFSPNAQYILSAAKDHKMIIWEKEGKQYNKLKGPSSLIKHVDFTSSASFLVSLGVAGDYILWDIEGNVIRHDYVPNQVSKIFFSKNGQFMLICDNQAISAVNAKGESLFEINLPENISLQETKETENGYLELLYSNNVTGALFMGYLPFSKATMESLIAMQQQL